MKLQITCRQATEYIIKREEGRLSPRTRMLLWLHLATCRLCKLFARQSRFISRNAANLDENIAEKLSQPDKQKMTASLRG